MSKKNFAALGLLLAATLIVAVGCGKDLGYRKTTGVVTLGGTPLEGATVMFVPQDQANGESGAGLTDAKGAYSANSGSVGVGLKPGEYKVTVMKSEVAADPDQAAFDAGEITYDELQTRKAKRGLDGGQKSESLVPAQYTSILTTPLTATVTDDSSKNNFDFDLEAAE